MWEFKGSSIALSRHNEQLLVSSLTSPLALGFHLPMAPSNHHNLAAQVLGVSVHASPSEIKYAYYRMMCLHHPDKHQGDPQAGQRTALINEARNMLLGHTLHPTLLRNRELVSEVLERPPSSGSEDETILSYNEWLKAQFCNVQEASIWP